MYHVKALNTLNVNFHFTIKLFFYQKMLFSSDVFNVFFTLDFMLYFYELVLGFLSHHNKTSA